VEPAPEEPVVSKELEYMVKEYDVLSSENSQLRDRVIQLEKEKKEAIEQHTEESEKLKNIASTALKTLKQEKFS
jgi:regulator of replication initiation timing